MKKIRTHEQCEKINYLLTFKSKEEIVDMLIDEEHKIDMCVTYINGFLEMLSGCTDVTTIVLKDMLEHAIKILEEENK